VNDYTCITSEIFLLGGGGGEKKYFCLEVKSCSLAHTNGY
jgi:hypothetical protein